MMMVKQMRLPLNMITQFVLNKYYLCSWRQNKAVPPTKSGPHKLHVPDTFVVPPQISYLILAAAMLDTPVQYLFNQFSILHSFC